MSGLRTYVEAPGLQLFRKDFTLAHFMSLNRFITMAYVSSHFESHRTHLSRYFARLSRRLNSGIGLFFGFRICSWVSEDANSSTAPNITRACAGQSCLWLVPFSARRASEDIICSRQKRISRCSASSVSAFENAILPGIQAKD